MDEPLNEKCSAAGTKLSANVSPRVYVCIERESEWVRLKHNDRLPTVIAAVEFYSHRDTVLPPQRIDTYPSGNDGHFEIVSSYRVTVRVSFE